MKLPLNNTLLEKAKGIKEKLPISKDKTPRDFFVALLLKPYSAGAILFEEEEKKLFVLANKESNLPAELDEATLEELLDASDKAISATEASLPSGASLSKTIFSVPHHWVEEGKITRDNLTKLKKICEELELTPVGFIVSIEAIVHFLQTKEGAPVTAIFVEIANDTVYVFIVKASRILEVKKRHISDNVIKTVEGLFKEVVSVNNLPQKIILLDYQGVERVQQEFLSHPWTKDLPFLHLPQVHVLEKGFENEAIISGVASQMGFSIVEERKIAAPDDMGGLAGVTGAVVSQVDAQDLGFSEVSEASEETLGEDVAGVNEAEDVEKDTIDDEESEMDFHEVSDTDEKSEEDTLDREELENVIPVDAQEPKIRSYHDAEPTIDDSFKDEETPVKKHAEQARSVEEEEGIEPEHDTHAGRRLPTVSLPAVGGILSLFKLGAVKKFVPSEIPKGYILLPVVLLVLVGVVGFFYYTMLLKAEVIVYTDQRVFEKEEDVVFATDEATSAQEKTIALAVTTQEAEGSAEKGVTGKKETGEKAKGEITLYNKTEQKRTFEKGNVIVGPNDLEFILLDEVNVASTSSFATNFSSAKAKIESSKFGKEYNIPSGQNFTVKGLSTANFFAKNDSAFSGGSSKEVEVVAQKDLDALTALVQKDIEEKAREAFGGQLSSDEVALPEPLSSSFKERKFSKKVGDESKTVSLNARIAYEMGVYKKEDIEQFVAELAEGEIPQGYTIQSDTSTIDVRDIQEADDDGIPATLAISAQYVPNLESASLTKEILGKSSKSAIERLQDVDGVTEVNILYKNKLPVFPLMLPRSEKNITFTVKAD